MNMKNLIVEIAQFKLASGVTDEEFIKEAEFVQKNFLEKQRGYIDRELLKAKDGQWIDILHWDSMEEAQRAAEVMMKEPTTQGFMQKNRSFKRQDVALGVDEKILSFIN